MISDPTQPTGSRLLFFDNLRILLLLLVIALHASQPYGPGGWWYDLEQSDRLEFSGTFFVLGLFFAVSATFFMSLFFLISGFFIAQSFDKKGARAFLQGRLKRLGLPLLVFVLGIMPLFMVFLCSLNLKELNTPLSFGKCITATFEFHHLWFIAQLLALNIVYTIWRLISDHRETVTSPQSTTVPGHKPIVGYILVLTLVLFLVRIWSPALKWDPVEVVEFARLPQYVGLFGIGVLASRRDWVQNFPTSTGRKWLWISLVTIASLPVLFWLSGGMDPLLGGLRWEAFVYAAWESVVGVGMAIGLIVLFRDKLNEQGPLKETLSANVYAMYLIHYPIVILLQIPLDTIEIPSLLKASIVLLLAVPICYLISQYIIRRLPYVEKILY